jgi:hypothetical protein
MRRTIELYGRLRDAGLGSSVDVEAPDGATSAQILGAVRAAFGPRAALLDGAVLATEQDVLRAEEPAPDVRLAALPPVCGG